MHALAGTGTSFAGMYIVELAVSDSRLAGAIGQAPLVDGFAAARLASPVRGLQLLAVALLDRLGSVFGRPPRNERPRRGNEAAIRLKCSNAFPRPLRREQPHQPLHRRYLFVYELNNSKRE